MREKRNEEREKKYPKVGLYIDGQWIYDRPAYQDVLNPSNEARLGCVPRATQGDLARALASADQGFRKWRETPVQERSRLLERTAALLRERSEDIATIITLEQGKPISDARLEVERACTFLEWDAAQALRTYGRIVPAASQMQQLVFKEPIGPVAAFTPWNVPISSPGRKVSASIASGCSVILKAAEETPATACAFVQCFIDAGLPKGVVNLVFGDPAEISSTLISSPVIRMVTLTGSVAVGKQLSQLAGAAMKPVLMELGGHAPVLVCDDVDAVKIGKLAAGSKMRMAGQICASPTRFIVHEGVYESFVTSFASASSEIQVGDGFEPGVQMGPVINNRRLRAIEELVADASSCGARVATGGHRIGDRGWFYAPTIIADAPIEAKAMTHEPFGPLALCVSVPSLDDGLALANSVAVGLSGYAFTNSLHDAERIGRELQCGNVSINHFGSPGADTPFGGVKESGIGREGGEGSLDSYTVTKTILQRTVRV